MRLMRWSPGSRTTVALAVAGLAGCGLVRSDPHGSEPAAGAPSTSECERDSDCTGDSFCAKEPGCAASPTDKGTCVPLPCQPHATSPACGCDDKAYLDECAAHAAGVNVMSDDACAQQPTPPACSANSDCDTQSYCYKKTCDGAAGVCVSKPRFLDCAPVADSPNQTCGCDHGTYHNDCEAAAYGVNVDFEGPCSVPTGACAEQSDCGDASDQPLVFCLPSSCASKAGTCTKVPSICSDVVSVVCGCDGKPYQNSCFAARARVGWQDTVGGVCVSAP